MLHADYFQVGGLRCHSVSRGNPRSMVQQTLAFGFCNWNDMPTVTYSEVSVLSSWDSFIHTFNPLALVS